MSSFEILNQALLTYSSVVRDNFTVKADAIDIISLITSTSNELKDLINQKADITELANVISGNSNEFLGILNEITYDLTSNLNDRLLISIYDANNIQSNIRFTQLETNKANIFNTQLTGTTTTQTIRSSGDIYTEGTLVASNLRILGETSIVNTVTTLTDQLSIVNHGTDSAVIVKQYGNANIAEFYNSTDLLTVIDNYGRIGINTSPRYELDINGSCYISNIYGDSSKTTISGIFIEDIFSSNLNLINTLDSYVKYNFDIIESNILIITNTINYGRDQLLSITGTSSSYLTTADKLASLEARISYLEQRIV